MLEHIQNVWFMQKTYLVILRTQVRKKVLPNPTQNSTVTYLKKNTSWWN